MFDARPSALVFVAILVLTVLPAAYWITAVADVGPAWEADRWGLENGELDNVIPARLFPHAAEVRLFAWAEWDEEGHPIQLVQDGSPLTRDEVDLLRRAVYYSNPPEWISLCCIPRHQFVFYGAQGEPLGALDVCFQCTCAHVRGERSPDPSRTWVSWDIEAIGGIVRAHGLTADLRRPIAVFVE